MSRRPHSESSCSPTLRSPKRARIEHLTPEDFKNGVFLAPMVRSGALPTRLFALKHGANLVWGPEMVDKAILNAERVVDPITGVISYNGKSRAMFTTHPIEKPYLIYQIGSADPDLAVQAAKTVMQDVSGIDLNCGCPKPFSTHAGMGAALLTNPDVLCSILTALRRAMPPEITVSAKIRLLPSQEDTLKLVERIVNTGISALTVHCRTRNMRDKDRAVIERLHEIVDFVEGMGRNIAVIENGDCTGLADAKRIRELTGAHSVMIARAAEANPSCFSPTPLVDLEETLSPAYLRLAQYLGNYWGLTKFCVAQFNGARVNIRKAESTKSKQFLAKAKDYDGVEEVVGSWTGEGEMKEIIQIIEARPKRHRDVEPELPGVHTEEGEEKNVEKTEDASQESSPGTGVDDAGGECTPEGTRNPEPPSTGAPRPVAIDPRYLALSRDRTTPTPSGRLTASS